MYNWQKFGPGKDPIEMTLTNQIWLLGTINKSTSVNMVLYIVTWVQDLEIVSSFFLLYIFLLDFFFAYLFCFGFSEIRFSCNRLPGIVLYDTLLRSFRSISSFFLSFSLGFFCFVFFFFISWGKLRWLRQNNKSLINVTEQGNELKLVLNPTFRREAGAFGSWD